MHLIFNNFHSTPIDSFRILQLDSSAPNEIDKSPLVQLAQLYRTLSILLDNKQSGIIVIRYPLYPVGSMTKVPDSEGNSISALPQEGPLRDLSSAVTTKLKLWKDFWRTRATALHNPEIAKLSNQELDASGLLGPWKFNLIQSGFATLPAIAIGRVISAFHPSTVPQPVDQFLDFDSKIWVTAQPMIGSVFSFLWPLVFPFILFMMARMMAWGSLKKKDSIPLASKRATGAYLYLDGAFGFYPQMISPLGLVIATAHLSSGVDAVGYVLFGIGVVWQGILSRWILAKKLFEFNGYSRKFKWFWMFHDQGRNLAPWNKYIFALSYAVPATLLFSAGTVYLLSTLIGLVGAAARQFFGNA